MKTKKALGGLLGLFGSFSALDFLTESLHHHQPTTANETQSEPQAKRIETTRKTSRKWGEGGGRIEPYLESAPLDLALDFISAPNLPHQIQQNQNETQQQPTSTASNSQRFDLDFELAVPPGRIGKWVWMCARAPRDERLCAWWA